MKLLIENQDDFTNAQALINWLDIALKQIGGKNGGATSYAYFESVVMNGLAEYRKANPLTPVKSAAEEKTE